VVGGGAVAERKVLSLLRSGARITLISPALTQTLGKLKQEGALIHKPRAFRKGDMKDALLVIAATSDEETNREIAAGAPCLVNVVDTPELANFIVPAVISRGALSVAVSTSGSSPALARSIRKEIETLYGPDIGGFLVFLRSLRAKSLRNIPDKKARERFLIEAGSPEVLLTLRAKGASKARELVLERFRAATGGAKQKPSRSASELKEHKEC
jgi:precorrin-2 dehydrogenase/sirohydrochlorin ferrochelatase